MSRKAVREAGEGQDAAEDPQESPATGAADTDHHGFWDGPKRRGDENDEAYAVVTDADRDLTGEQTLAYMGNVAQIDVGELSQLAEWAESKACLACTSEIREDDDPALVEHDECRTALRVGRLLRRYH